MATKKELTHKKEGKNHDSKDSQNRKKAGRQPGTIKTGGRIKGSTNKKTLEVIDTLAKLKCSPIEGMAKIAMDARSPLDAESLKATKEIKKLLKDKPKLLEFFEMILQSWTHHSPELRAKMYSELAQYVFPKRKAVEVSGEDGMPIAVDAVVRTIVDPKGK
jgi:hypothetical protein